MVGRAQSLSVKIFWLNDHCSSDVTFKWVFLRSVVLTIACMAISPYEMCVDVCKSWKDFWRLFFTQTIVFMLMYRKYVWVADNCNYFTSSIQFSWLSLFTLRDVVAFHVTLVDIIIWVWQHYNIQQMLTSICKTDSLNEL